MSGEQWDPGISNGVGVAPGHVFGGRYRVVRLLGAGGMGAVFEAKHEAIGKVVAIKVLHPTLANDPKFSVRFLQEAKTATEVHHRNIVQILDFGVEDGRPFMVMEYLHGESLSALLARERRLAPATVIRILEPVLRALAVAHDRGVVHRDLKPDNIFLAREDDAEEPVTKLLDFGIAKRASAEDLKLTDTRASMGTPTYMAPEQAMGARDVTPAADQFAIGVILYEAFSGRVPHEGETYNAVIIAKVTGTPKHLREYRPDLDPALAAAVMRTLEQKPEDRFPTLLALREALMPFKDVTTARLSVAPPPTTPGDETKADGTPLAREGFASTLPAIASVAVPPGISGTGTKTPDVWSTDAEIALLGGRKDEAPKAAEEPAKTEPARKAFPSWVLGAAGALLVAVLVGSRFAATSAPPPTPVQVTTHAATSSERRSEEPVTFRVRVEPSTAEIVLDGQSVGRGTAEVIRPRDGHRHQLVLRAPGYTEVTEVLVSDGDVRVDRVLTSTQPAATPPAPNAGAVHHAGPATSAPATTGSGPRRPHIDRDNPF